MQAIAASPHVVVDGEAVSPLSTVLSHWPNSGTPWELKADLSAEIAFNYLDANGDTSGWVTNTHLDVDGFVSVFVLAAARLADARRDRLIEVAAAGDFADRASRSAARVAMAIGTLIDRSVSPWPASTFSGGKHDVVAKQYQRLLDEFPDLVDDIDRAQALWRDEDASLSAAETAIDGGQIRVETVSDADVGLVWMKDGWSATAPHRSVLQQDTPCHPLAVHPRTPAYRVAYIDTTTRQYSLSYRFESWVQLVSRAAGRADLRPLARILTDAEPDGGEWIATGRKTFVGGMWRRDRAPSGIEPDEFAAIVTDYLRDAPITWSPYDPKPGESESSTRPRRRVGYTTAARATGGADSWSAWLADPSRTGTSDPAVITRAIDRATGNRPEHIERLLHGETNEVYDITTANGQRVVLRIGRYPHSLFPAEQWALAAAAQQGASVPEVLLVDELEAESESLAVCVQRHAGGWPVQQLASDAAAAEPYEAVVIEAGRHLARVHRVETSGFGFPLDANGHGPDTSWADFLSMPARGPEWYRPAAEQAGYDRDRFDRAIRLLDEHAAIYEGAPRLVHGDFGAKHVLATSDGDFRALIDFEVCRGGDPAYDIAAWDFYFHNTLRTDWLLSGYQEVGDLGPELDLRLSLYRLLLAIRLLGQSMNGFTGFVPRATKTIDRELAALS